ncbi:hypothetical protein ACEPAI_7535 [Sanghuangporus weigelae]
MEQRHPISELTNLDHFKQAIRDIVLGAFDFRSLYLLLTFPQNSPPFLVQERSAILHRDISLHSLMVRYNDNGTVHGVLIDFDLASVGEPAGEGHHGRWSGTRRFLATNLLEKETPLYLERFGWESFFYVLCWIGTHYSNGTKIKTDALKTWDAGDDETLSKVKKLLLIGFDSPLDTLFTDFYKPLYWAWVHGLQSMFHDAHQAKNEFRRAKAINPEHDTLVFDEETLGGIVTWDRIWKILKN